MCAYVVYEQNQLELNRKPIFWRMNFSLKNGIIKGNSVVKEWRDGYTSDAEHKQGQQVRLKPKNDFIFKRLFGESDVKESLLSLLNAIFQQERRQQLTDISIVEDDKKLTKEMIKDKTGRLDILAETSEGVQINLEMQLTNKKNMDKRTLFYYGKLYVQSIQSGENYHDLKRTITVNLLDFNYLPHKQYHSVYRLYEESGRDLLTDVLEVHFIEFPKFEKVLKDLKNPLHRWLMYFDENITDEKLKELMEMDPVIKKTEERLKWLSSDDETRRLYEYREHSRIERNSIFDDGRQEGELTALLKVAENLMQRGASLEEILEITGLSEEQLQKLK